MISKTILIIFIFVSLINSYLDLKNFHISLILNYLGIISCIILGLIEIPNKLFINNLLGGILLLLLFLLVRQISHKGLGLGDIHYSFFCGLISGIPGFILSSLISSLIGIIIFLFIKILSKSRSIKKKKIPFIPIMFIGTIISFIILKKYNLQTYL